ncbi:MAG: hypothetical protein JKX67_08650 [Colwellia sp.]|nr:hypothetical protein [Colwellia sp.]
MLKYVAIKKYGYKLLPRLQQRYGEQLFYTASQIRATVYQCNFNPKFLPLGYLLFLDPSLLIQLMHEEFPAVCINNYKRDICHYLDKRKYHGHLQLLSL